MSIAYPLQTTGIHTPNHPDARVKCNENISTFIHEFAGHSCTRGGGAVKGKDSNVMHMYGMKSHGPGAWKSDCLWAIVFGVAKKCNLFVLSGGASKWEIRHCVSAFAFAVIKFRLY